MVGGGEKSKRMSEMLEAVAYTRLAITFPH